MATHTVESARRRIGKTQKECADYLGINVTNFSLKENGKQKWELEQAFKFVEFINKYLENKITPEDIDWKF